MRLVNAVSFNMVKDFDKEGGILEASRPITVEEAKQLYTESAVGHPFTAALLSNILGEEVTANRVTLSLEKGEKVLLAQYVGPRLEEGVTELPEGAKLSFHVVEVK